ncbi:hypothetical protein [Collimonas pratensis]|uniref:Uncharacterized protein n=1 Tax=Collimonas pratensis TaxID=279113 RepID=A0A127Q8N4_9BURK|nr:hypothetical protein [Collimonas pratensis]AMP06403.1 hypothetical protein CPter91_4083 [Collimonas pratensis]AMP16279.1 hypothetical protein CPter291_4046 [Collimonas pratensis]NKI70610.1 hypothetical protein [Collimonas pratensis]
MSKFVPFADESATLAIGKLNVENRLDRVSLFGDLDLTLDQAGLEHAKTLQALLDNVVAVLESQTLPDKIAAAPVVKVSNPF